MKIKTTLKAIAIAVPGLVAMPVGATWTPSGYTTSSPPFVYNSAANGYTEGLYTEGVSTSIYHYSLGTKRGGGYDDIDDGTAYNCTVYAETYMWDESTYSRGESYVGDSLHGTGYAYGEVDSSY